jgi:hypothetical protein
MLELAAQATVRVHTSGARIVDAGVNWRIRTVLPTADRIGRGRERCRGRPHSGFAGRIVPLRAAADIKGVDASESTITRRTHRLVDSVLNFPNP